MLSEEREISEYLHTNGSFFTLEQIREKLSSKKDKKVSTQEETNDPILLNFVQKKDIFYYIQNNYSDYGVTETAVDNFIKYGYLYNDLLKIGSKKIVLKNKVDHIFNTNIVNLDHNDFLKALSFSCQMLSKVENYQVRFGTFFDKMAKRNGTALNYLERHLVGKLGEIATIKHINTILKNEFHSELNVEMSFNLDQVEAADIVNLRNTKNNVLVNAKKRVQIKTSTGLNSVVLKEDKSKLDSETFNVDYCSFAQLLNSPLVFLIDLLQKIATSYTLQDNIEKIVTQDINKDLLNTTVKLSGFIERTNMDLVTKGQILKPLGDIANDSYYAYICNLEQDYSVLAKKIIK